jgi:hypothetical protein
MLEGAISGVCPRCQDVEQRASISQTDAGGRGESWESHRVLAVYSWERLQPPPELVI